MSPCFFAFKDDSLKTRFTQQVTNCMVGSRNGLKPDVESPMSSTGYLQDAVAQRSDRCKRRRLGSSSCDPMLVTEDLHDLLQWQGIWGSNLHGIPLGDYNCLLVEDNTTVSGDSKPQNCSPSLEKELISPSSSSQKDTLPDNSDNEETHNSRGIITSFRSSLLPKDQHEDERNKMKKRKVVYPFAVLKPVGLEGDVTLADINKRILMRPTRPVKHPVGEFALRPCVLAGGQGLSGKAVVGLTRIHTQGNGTITIIRTRG